MGLIEKMIQTHKGTCWSREKILAVQNNRLKALVKFAKEKSPFYQKLYAELGENFSLKDLPPVSKPELMSHFDQVLTDRNITMERIESFTQNLDNIGRMIDDKYLIFKTSGSTGNPASVNKSICT